MLLAKQLQQQSLPPLQQLSIPNSGQKRKEGKKWDFSGKFG